MSSPAHPALHAYEALLGALGSAPSLEALNACARERGLANAHGAPLRFVRAPARPSSALAYERSIVERGEIATRERNAHDAWNAFAWLLFPRTKLALSALHVAQGASRAAAPEVGGGARGRIRDAATLLDESGALVLTSDPSLVELWRAHQWRALFHDRARDVERSMRIAVLGHGALARLERPFTALTLRVLAVQAEGRDDAGPGVLDATVASWLAQHASRFAPRDLLALPIAAWPGWDWQGRGPARFDDTGVYRPRPLREAGRGEHREP